MKRENEQRPEAILDESGGVLVAADAIRSGIPRNVVYQFMRERRLEKASPGIFGDPAEFPDGLCTLQLRYPKIVYSHNIALYLRSMAEREPVPVTVMVDLSYNVGSLAGRQRVARLLRQARVVRAWGLRSRDAGK